eukprot:XP_020404496.1 uncharacterized protein LOC109944213 [Zea mays]
MAACPRPGVPPRLAALAPPRAAWPGVPPRLGADPPPSFLSPPAQPPARPRRAASRSRGPALAAHRRGRPWRHRPGSGAPRRGPGALPLPRPDPPPSPARHGGAPTRPRPGRSAAVPGMRERPSSSPRRRGVPRPSGAACPARPERSPAPSPARSPARPDPVPLPRPWCAAMARPRQPSRDAACPAPARCGHGVSARHGLELGPLGPDVCVARSRHISVALHAHVLAWCARCFDTARRALVALVYP